MLPTDEAAGPGAVPAGAASATVSDGSSDVEPAGDEPAGATGDEERDGSERAPEEAGYGHGV